MTTTSVQTSRLTDFISRESLLAHWQGHRSLTRRVIAAFPERELFEFSVGGMRPFAQLVMEMIGMAVPGIVGVATGKWDTVTDFAQEPPATKTALLAQWDAVTHHLDAHWGSIPEGRFQEMDVAFGQYEGPVYWTLLYFIDNEIHHRAQGYVYLRALGVVPPPFWER